MIVGSWPNQMLLFCVYITDEFLYLQELFVWKDAVPEGNLHTLHLFLQLYANRRYEISSLHHFSIHLVIQELLTYDSLVSLSDSIALKRVSIVYSTELIDRTNRF